MPNKAQELLDQPSHSAQARIKMLEALGGVSIGNMSAQDSPAAVRWRSEGFEVHGPASCTKPALHRKRPGAQFLKQRVVNDITNGRISSGTSATGSEVILVFILFRRDPGHTVGGIATKSRFTRQAISNVKKKQKPLIGKPIVKAPDPLLDDCEISHSERPECPEASPCVRYNPPLLPLGIDQLFPVLVPAGVEWSVAWQRGGRKQPPIAGP